MRHRQHCCDPKVCSRAKRYYDPIKKHYYNISNLFVADPFPDYPNKVLPVANTYFDVHTHHYYKLGHLFGINPCQRRCPCHNGTIIVSENNPFENPTENDNVFYNNCNCTFYKLDKLDPNAEIMRVET